MPDDGENGFWIMSCFILISPYGRDNMKGSYYNIVMTEKLNTFAIVAVEDMQLE